MARRMTRAVTMKAQMLVTLEVAVNSKGTVPNEFLSIISLLLYFPMIQKENSLRTSPVLL
jgi:hypothetical protein